MNKLNFLSKLLPGLLPLIVFVIADMVWGAQVGLTVAVGFGAVEFLYSLIRHKKVDYFILLDTALLVLLGGVSLLLENETFFLLKPALMESVLVLILVFSLYSSHNIIEQMTRRYLRGVFLTKAQVLEFRRHMKVSVGLISFHIVLVVICSYGAPHHVWGFVAGPLLYILFGVVVLFEYLRARLIRSKLKQEEWLPVVDENGAVKGRVARSICHAGEKTLHPVIHLHVISPCGIFLQKRPIYKDIMPGKWDTAVGGHIAFGENIEDALKREALEEIGLENFKFRFTLKYVWETELERELVFMFITEDYENIIINRDEVEDGKLWPLKQVEANLGKEVFTPNFEKEFEFLKCTLFLAKANSTAAHG